MNSDFWCTKTWVFQDLPHQIWEAQTADGHVSSLLVRFFHNKVFFLLNNLTRCYFTYWSVDTLSSIFTVIGALFCFYGLYKLVEQKKRLILFFILLGPILTFLEIPNRQFGDRFLFLSQIGSMTVGLMYFFKLINRRINKSHYAK